MLDWHADALAGLIDLGRTDVGVERRHLLNAAAYSLAALTLPGEQWWEKMADLGRARRIAAGRRISRGDVDAVRDMASVLSHIDQRRGGGHARTAVVQYLTSDVAGYLRGSFSDDQVRRDMFSAASELAYLSGWMAFDNAEHAIAQRYYTVAVKLAAEADDPPMAGHVLRAMAHQAIDLGHPRHALDLAAASMDGQRYALATPRERSLFGVFYARMLAATEQPKHAAELIRAQDDLAAAKPGDEDPNRVFFVGEASLADQTARTLRDAGDLNGAVREFRHSIRTRKTAMFTRSHALTLVGLGEVQARQGSIEQACATWSRALDAMDGIRSGRIRQVIIDMRSILSPLRRRGIPAVAELDAQAASYPRG